MTFSTSCFDEDLKRCSRCLYDEKTPGIFFDQGGVCNYCISYDQWDKQYPTGEIGHKILKQLATQIRKEGQRKAFDCAVGVSGGCDSSYLLYQAKELGLRPLAVHFDNTWNSTIATENITRVLRGLEVPLFTYVVDNQEYDDLYRAFLKAGVPDIEAPTDIGLAATLYQAAEKYGLRYILEGHSFRTEGISPLGWLYMDGLYIESIHKTFGLLPLRTFPNMKMAAFLKWTAVKRIRKLRPLYHIDYRKENAKKFLAEKFGWTWYGGHHLENRFTAFYHSYFMPRRFGIDQRVNGYSALIRSGQMDRKEGLRQLQTPPYLEEEIVALVKKRLGFTDETFERLMEIPRKTYRDYKTYKQVFERFRWFFRLLAEADLVPKSFYMKYTAPVSAGQGLR